MCASSSPPTRRLGPVATDTELKPRIPLLAVIAVAWAALGDIPTDIPLGPISLSGAATVGLALLCLFLAPTLTIARTLGAPQKPSARYEPFVSAPQQWIPTTLVLFVAIATVRMAVDSVGEGIQNVSVYVMFVLTIGLVALNSSSGTAAIVVHGMQITGLSVSLIYIAGKLAGLSLIGARSFALVALVFLSTLVPYKGRNLLLRAAPFVIVLAIALSASRTALFIGIALLAFMAARAHRSFRMTGFIVLFAGAVLAAYWMLTEYPPIRDRFIGGDNAIVGGIQINTSGRTQFWTMLIDSIRNSPFIGHGPGTAAALINDNFQNVGHPHSDYLRIIHDFGWLGMALFASGYIVLIGRVVRRIRTHDSEVDWAAFLALIAVAAGAITDNVIVYPFVMLPVATLVGLSLSRPIPTTSRFTNRPAHLNSRRIPARHVDMT